MVRFDSVALYNALDQERKRRDMTWKEVADAIGVSQSAILNTRKGGRMEVDGMLAMVYWLKVQVESFVVETER